MKTTRTTDKAGNTWTLHTHCGYTIGIGRKGWKTGNIPATYIGRPTIYGNHVWMNSEADRADCIQEYRRDISAAYNDRTGTHQWNVRRDLDPLMTQLLSHGKIALLCFCAPKPCHGDVIAEIIFQMMDDRHEDEQQQKRDYLRGEE